MKIKLQSVKERGNLNEERVVLRAVVDADIGRYLLGIGRYTGEDNVSNELSRVFWFPDKDVKAGDFVVLFTKSGTNRQYANKSDSVTHAFHMGLLQPIWNSSDSAAILFEVPEWQARKASE